MTNHFSRLRALRYLCILAALLLTQLTPPAAHADNLTKLYSFSPNYASGNQPYSKLIQAPDGFFYGTTTYGGIGYGTIFRMSTAGTVTTLYSFDYSTTGYYPAGGLFRDADGTFYGATEYGGVNSYGVVYKMTIAIVGGNPVATVTPYYSFKGSNSTTPALSEPGYPYFGELIKGSDGNLYGTTLYGGVNNNGAVYSLSIVSSGSPTLTLVYSFNSALSGPYYPYAGVTEGNDGKLYGTTYYGGAHGVGTVYSLTKDGVTFTDIHDFGASAADGYYPQSQLTKSSAGDLYGVTYYGGGAYDGTLYKVSSAGVYSQLYTFDGNAGKAPYTSPILAADGKLYGTTRAGGSSGLDTGIVYKYDLTANTISVFSQFDGINGYYPNALTQGADKSFYGTSQYGGFTNREAGFTNGSGSAFKITTAGVISLLYSFYTHTGYNPYGRTVQGPDGQFYGTTYYGGYYDNGTIYKSDANGSMTILHHFNNNRPGYEGYYPQAGLIVGTDGNLYGSTIAGGVYGNGTIFKVTTAGVLTVLYNLRVSQGSNILAPLLQAKDGNFYGAAYTGGVNGSGTIFKLAGTVFTVLHQFTSINGQGYSPQGGLAQDTTGNLYGTTNYGGANSGGTLYEINTTGTSFNTIYSFSSGTGNLGYYPTTQLLYSGGAMYGAAQYGGANSYGTLFKFTPAGSSSVTPTDLHDFAYATDGYYPQYGLALGPNGKFYGATAYGGANGGGVAFSLDTSNNFTSLYSFNTTPGTGAYYPNDGVIVGSDNNLYLGTRSAGDFNYGTFDTIDISLHFAVKVSTSVTVTLSALTLSGGTYNGNLTVKNISTKTILGPVNVVLTGLTGGTTLVNKAGDVPSGYLEAGSPYIQANPAGSAHGIFALGAGKSVLIPVHFSANTGTSASSQTYLRRF